MDQLEQASDTVDQPQIPPAEMLIAILGMTNIADHLGETELAAIGDDVCREHRIDVESMKPWTDRMKRGVDLASLVKEDKTYPFESASNVKYPLITTAALQFNARAYPAIVPPGEMVNVKTFGADPTGAKAARAERVGHYMSYQLSTEIEEWEETTDELLTILPIVGTVVRKVWFDPSEGRIKARIIQPGRFVVNAGVTTLSEAPRVGEELSLYPSEIKTRRNSEVFRDIEYVESGGEDKDRAQEFIEQHRRLDLDGDGFGEPYIVTVHRDSKKVARIVADFDTEDVQLNQSGKVMSIRRGSYFIPYHFLPSIEGGFFGTGLGFLLGDISETINTIINMMIDAGHMASRGGGFVGSEFRIKGGSQQFRPGEWKLMTARGAAIRDSIVPMTFPSADATLFQLLGLLIDAGKNVASINDVITGDAGSRQMTATTTMALIEQGMAVFTAAYKRIFRSLKKEFRLIAKINSETVSPEKYNAFHDMQADTGGQGAVDPRADYDLSNLDIEPVADPRSVTKMQEAAKAEILLQMSEKGLVDKGEASSRILQAASIPNIEDLAPRPDPMQQQMMQMQAQSLQADLTLKMVSINQAIADIDKTRSETVKNMSEASAKESMVHLDRAKHVLEMMRDGIGQTIGGSIGGVAGAPGNQGAAGMPVFDNSGPVGGGNVSVLERNPMAGSGQVVPVAGQGTGGGFV